MRYFIDCEFDGHGGPLLSMGIVCEDDRTLHVRTYEEPRDPWVIANVMPKMSTERAEWSAWRRLELIGDVIREFIGEDQEPVIIADSPVDIWRFCQALSTDEDGGWASTNYPRMTFEVHNVDCYPTDLPGAVQHNAWWDAMPLRHKLDAQNAA